MCVECVHVCGVCSCVWSVFMCVECVHVCGVLSELLMGYNMYVYKGNQLVPYLL